MKLTLLVQGKETRERLVQAATPEEIELKLDTAYGQDGDNLFVVGFEGEGESLALARKMADFRDGVFDEGTCLLLIDDPSERFCEHLYARFGRFERTLRSVLRLALCSEKGNFKDKLIKELESQTLEEIHAGWLCDDGFQKRIRDVVGNKSRHFSKEQLIAIAEGTESDTVWSRSFPDDAMATVRERFKDIQGRRNDVMHFHRMSYRLFNDTLKLVEKADDELEAYNDRLMRGEDAPIGASGSIESAIKALGSIYSQMDYHERFAEVMDELSSLIRMPEGVLANSRENLGTHIDKTALYSLLLANSAMENSPGVIESMNKIASLAAQFTSEHGGKRPAYGPTGDVAAVEDDAQNERS